MPKVIVNDLFTVVLPEGRVLSASDLRAERMSSIEYARETFYSRYSDFNVPYFTREVADQLAEKFGGEVKPAALAM